MIRYIYLILMWYFFFNFLGPGYILYNLCIKVLTSQAEARLVTGPRGFQLGDNLLLISTTDYFRQNPVIIAFFDPNA